jgi:hypothetical protein
LKNRDEHDIEVSGGFTDLDGERYYAIRNVNRMAPFFVSVISNSDHWLFVSSTGGLTAGRISPDTALFPYITVDKVHESTLHTGSKTILRVAANGSSTLWEPCKSNPDDRYELTRNIYKNTLGNKLCFEEINHDLGLAYRYTWSTSDAFGFVRHTEIENLGDDPVTVDVLDGLRNILPAGTPRFAQTNTSNLVDAYKWTELDETTRLAMFTLYSGVTDRAEPCESLRANTAFCLGLDDYKVLISTNQLDSFRSGEDVETEQMRRGIRGAFFINTTLSMTSGSKQSWQLVADIEQDQGEVIALMQQLADRAALQKSLRGDVQKGSDELARIMGAADGFQATAEETTSHHHYANVLFNVLRGGIFDDQYNISSWDLLCTLREFNRDVVAKHEKALKALPDSLPLGELLTFVTAQGDPQLERLCREYLPIRFGRRHGDPSRPWNQFAIRTQDEDGHRLLSYEGNWRDIFQNWEALALSYPDFVESMIAKFVNASTMDGYNPYRITKEGIDWEVEEPDDPWSYIGYWGDHQIIYLQKLLELSSQFHPDMLAELLKKRVYAYANVPYRIKPFAALLANPKDTVVYDEELAQIIDSRVAATGADGKLVMDADGQVLLVNLYEKLLVPLLAKLGNFVVDGGIWMNTQRPEWNDANNALVGQGLSMVTLCYMRRYVCFLQELFAPLAGAVQLSAEVHRWLTETGNALADLAARLNSGPVSPADRSASLTALGEAASHYRETVYAQGKLSAPVDEAPATVTTMLDNALQAIDHSIAANLRDDGLYHAYNLLEIDNGDLSIDTLYPMLEGQVAALSSGAVAPGDAIHVLEALFASEVYRPDQKSFMLYPDRKLPSFLEKNRVAADKVESIALLGTMLAAGDNRIISKDAAGNYRFAADFVNVGALNDRLDELQTQYGEELSAARAPLCELYESVFDHQSFTGRSGGMFGFEGLGCIYWHMVSKLLLAVQENYFAARALKADADTCRRLGELYYKVREGIGFNKTPAEYGAFPTDPYSHTPKHSGARQPGMTGQVKEEILTRFGELGIRVHDGMANFDPCLLRRVEFVPSPQPFRYLDVSGTWQEIALADNALAFTWCQVPIVYRLAAKPNDTVTVTLSDGSQQSMPELSADLCRELFARSGYIRKLEISIASNNLFET